MHSPLNLDVASLPLTALFPTRFGGDSRPLQSSIQTFGVLQPPRLYKDDDGKLTVLDGLQRIRIASEIGLMELSCFVYEREHLTTENAFLMVLELNRWSRTFNLAEKALLLKAAHSVFPAGKIPRAFWSLTDIPHNMAVVQQLRDFLKLPVAVQKYAINNDTPLSTIVGMLRFKPEEIEKLASQLFILPLNPNALSEVVSLLNDIAKKEGCSALEVLDSILPAIELEFTPRQKERKLRHLLQVRRNPDYEKRLANFENRVKKLPVGPHTKIVPAPFFEENYVDVMTRFTSQKDINDFIEILKDASWADLMIK